MSTYVLTVQFRILTLCLNYWVWNLMLQTFTCQPGFNCTIQNTTLLTRCMRKLLDVNSHRLFPAKVYAKRSYATYWQCTVRPKGNPCKASVAERDGTFQAGKNSHNHSADVGAATARKIVTTVKAKALENKFKPASAIVNEVINSLVLCVKSPHSLVHVFWPKELVNITPYAAWRKLYELKIILSNTV